MDSFYEFDPTPPSRWVRVATTPLGDALRGRFSGRYGARQEIAASGLPTPVAGIIYAIVQKTRLWRSEKLDVTRELINHFSDGLDTDRTPEQLIADFGSAKQAASLIRHAKLRQRPLSWQTWWYASRAFAATATILAIAYGLLAARFLLTRPSINHNYWEEINASRTLPEAERAWPLYREALLALTPEDRKELASLIDANELTGPRASALVDRCQQTLDLVRQAARRPQMGYLVGDPADRAAALAAGNETVFPAGSHLAADNANLIAMTLDGLQELRNLARLMTLDAIRAAETDNGGRVVEDIQSLLAMSAQTFQPKAMLVEQLIGTGIFGSAVDTVGQILWDLPESLSDEQLRDLAHSFAAYRHGDLSFNLDGERLLFLDQLQRIYSDDGLGDGRISPAGLRGLEMLSLFDNSVPEPIASGLRPGIATTISNRAETERSHRELLARVLAAHEGPPWQWNAEEIKNIQELCERGKQHPATRLRHTLFNVFISGLSGVLNAPERTVLQRDTVQAAIALVLWHRRHGSWPERLDQLVPMLLPAIPLDHFDGQPLRYVVRDGKPILYSIGGDFDDDGGLPTTPEDQAISGFGPKPDPSASTKGFDSRSGDGILWPPLPLEKPAAVDEESTATETTPAP